MSAPLLRELPGAARQMAERLGARSLSAGRAQFRQSGTLRNLGSRRWMRFSARQWIDFAGCNFDWRARVGPLGLVQVQDSLVEEHPTGAVNVLGIVPLARADASAQLLKGELMRYLAELPWCPDAILSNPALQWETVDDRRLRVSASLGDATGAIVVTHDEEGLPLAIAGQRPAKEGQTFVEREWHGSFADWRDFDGRWIPQSGRVWWIVDGAPFDVWRGRIAQWQAPPG